MFSQDPRDEDFVQNPYPAYDRMRDLGGRVFWEQYGHWCFARHDDVSVLLRDRRFGRQILHVASRQELGWPEPDPRLAPFEAMERHSLLELEPPDHTRLRALVTRAFVSRAVERMRPRIAAFANGLIDRFEKDQRVELIEAYATPVPVLVITELLGVPPEKSADLLDWSHRMVAMYQFGRTWQTGESAVSATTAFVSYLRGLVAERRRRPLDDLISSLIAAENEGGKLTEDELISTVILLLNAGHEATVHAIANGVKALIEAGSPPITDKGLAADELLRFDAPLHLFTRYVLEDLEFQGIPLKKGDKVGLLLGAANRDPERFANPNTLNVTRQPNPHVSFGAGIHFCIGAPLARAELDIAMPLLFERLPGLRLANPPKYRDTYHFHGLERLELAW